MIPATIDRHPAYPIVNQKMSRRAEHVGNIWRRAVATVAHADDVHLSSDAPTARKGSYEWYQDLKGLNACVVGNSGAPVGTKYEALEAVPAARRGSYAWYAELKENSFNAIRIGCGAPSLSGNSLGVKKDLITVKNDAPHTHDAVTQPGDAAKLKNLYRVNSKRRRRAGGSRGSRVSAGDGDMSRESAGPRTSRAKERTPTPWWVTRGC